MTCMNSKYLSKEMKSKYTKMFKIDMIRNKLGNLYFIYENFLISVVKLTVSLLHSDKLCYIFFMVYLYRGAVPHNRQNWRNYEGFFEEVQPCMDAFLCVCLSDLVGNVREDGDGSIFSGAYGTG